MAQVIDATFATNLATGGELSADQSNDSHSPPRALDGDLDTWWELPRADHCHADVETPKETSFDVVSLQEAVDHRGQRIESFPLMSGWLKWMRLTSDDGRSQAVAAAEYAGYDDQVRIRITVRVLNRRWPKLDSSSKLNWFKLLPFPSEMPTVP